MAYLEVPCTPSAPTKCGAVGDVNALAVPTKHRTVGVVSVRLTGHGRGLEYNAIIIAVVLTLCTRKAQTTARQTIFGSMAVGSMTLLWALATTIRRRTLPWKTRSGGSPINRASFPYETTGNDASAAAVMDRVNIVMDATRCVVCAVTVARRSQEVRVRASGTVLPDGTAVRVHKAATKTKEKIKNAINKIHGSVSVDD